MQTWLIVGLGGFLGSVCRYLLSLLPYAQRSGFPMITLLINITGAFIIGMLAGVAGRYAGESSGWMLFLRVGFCGGFTTFSTFALELSGLMNSGRFLAGIAYVTLSVLFGVLSVYGGKALFS